MNRTAPAQRRIDQGHTDRIPGEAGEHRAAQPFGDRPGAGQRQDQRERLAHAESPRQPGGKHRIDGEVERQQDHRDPAEPGRHRRLEGEGGRDPVEADGELADAEPPADQQGAAQRPARARRARTSAAKASSISGHQPTGWNAKADAAPSDQGERGRARCKFGHRLTGDACRQARDFSGAWSRTA